MGPRAQGTDCREFSSLADGSNRVTLALISAFHFHSTSSFFHFFSQQNARNWQSGTFLSWGRANHRTAPVSRWGCGRRSWSCAWTCAKGCFQSAEQLTGICLFGLDSSWIWSEGFWRSSFLCSTFPPCQVFNVNRNSHGCERHTLTSLASLSTFAFPYPVQLMSALWNSEDSDSTTSPYGRLIVILIPFFTKSLYWGKWRLRLPVQTLISLPRIK